jgi:hypothetical protein
VQIEVLAVLANARALEAIGFGLRDPLLAGFNDRRTAMRRGVHALFDLDRRHCQPGGRFASGRECPAMPLPLAVRRRREIVGEPSRVLAGLAAMCVF